MEEKTIKKMTQPQTPSEYLHNKNKQEQTFFSYHPVLGGHYYPNGLPIPKTEYESFYPLTNTIQLPNRRWKGENLAPHQKLIQ